MKIYPNTKKNPLSIILVLMLAAAVITGCTPSTPTTTAPTTAPETPTSAQDPALSATPTAQTMPETETTPPEGAPPSEAVNDLVALLENQPLAVFFEDSWKALLLRDPETVLAEGLNDIFGVNDVQLTDISDAYVRETHQLYQAVLDLLHTYDRASLSPQEQISYDVYEWHLEDTLQQQQFMYYDYPATYFMHTSVAGQTELFFTDLHPLADQQDAEDYITRLKQIDVKFEQLQEGLALRSAAGIIPPQFSLQWALYGLRNLAGSSAKRTPYYTAFETKINALDNISHAEKQTLLNEVEDVIDNTVLPTYAALVATLTQLEASAPQVDGVWQFPAGDAYYAYRLRHYTTTDMSADEIHELGLQELDRIHDEMRVIFDTLGYPQDESVIELFNRVEDDSEHIPGNAVLETYESLIRDAEQNLDAVFDLRPQAEVVVIGDPNGGGYYISAAVDGSRPGAFYAGTNGGGEPYYAMPTLAYHEAVPGHHFQIALAQEADLPSFRRGLGFTGYAEGWALYAEYLAKELGWYADDPYGDLGRLQAEAFRAARLVVDTGIHAQGWTFAEAETFFSENVGFASGDSVNVEYQIARYVVWPGQATAYKVGMLKIQELRQHAEDQLGDLFDIREFHNVVLSNGSMPLTVLEKVIDNYIADKLSL